MTVSGDPPTVAVLNRLDWQLGEAGRREHRFSWLRDVRGDWLAVDAYYPSNRVVLIASADPDVLEHCEQAVPANGLYLLTLEPEDLTPGGSSDGLANRLRDRLIQQGWAPRAVIGLGSMPASDVAPAPLRSPPERPRETWAARQSPARRRSGDPASGVVLVLIAVAELVIGGGVIGLGAGDYVLGFGLLLDACARVLGAIAASQNGDPDAAWSAVLFGSPVLWSRRNLSGDAAVLAQVTAIIAGFAVAVGLLMAIL